MSSKADRRNFLDEMVVSSSGWRGVFAAGAEERGAEVAEHKLEVVTAAAYALARLFSERSPGEAVILATDSRPTGPEIARRMAELFLGMGIPLRYLGVSPTPEVLAYAAAAEEVAGFVIITASHNPIGHNGIKFGLADGRVAGGELASETSDAFRRTVTEDDRFAEAEQYRRRGAALGTAEMEAAEPRYKAEAEEAYTGKVIESIVRAPMDAQGGELLSKLEAGLAAEPIGIVIDFNGSARSRSIDTELLGRLGVRLELLNDAPGEIAHQIVPEGRGLAACKEALTAAHRRDPAFRLGYTADNDGDRGNLVFINGATGEAQELHAQEVFALAAVAELSWNELLAVHGAPPALVVNGPTSLRVDTIARLWNADLFRAEVGEANVIDRALELREKRVIIMGEGSNGGNITPPSLVRDPLSTVGAMIKLARSEAYDSWFCKASLPVPSGRDLWSLVKALPAYLTTGATEPRAVISIKSEDHGALKSAYEAIFPAAFEERREWLRTACGVEHFRIVNYEGTAEREGAGNRTGSGRGGFKIEFLDASGTPRGFLWMRGSKTEPVFRVMADIASEDPEREAELLRWHRELVTRADAVASGG